MSKKLILLSTPLLAISIITSCSHQSYLKTDNEILRRPSSEEIYFHGIQGLNLENVKNWTEGFFSRNTPENTKLSDQFSVVDSIEKRFIENNNINSFLEDVLKLNLHHTYDGQESYHKIAEGLLALRKRIRTQLSSRPKYTKEALLLVELLAEEVLYVQSLKFKMKKNLMRFDYTSNINCKKTFLINKTKVCQGDIIVSKGEAGSSSVLARISDTPGNFSHSATVYFDDAGEKFYMVEAFIEDGVKLRDPNNDYNSIDNPKMRLEIYRAKNQATHEAGELGVGEFVKRMKENNPGVDLTKIAGYPYNAKMEEGTSDRFFCSQLVYKAYEDQEYIKLKPEENPYAKTYWSKVENKGRASFLRDYLGTNTTFPAPSDISLNPHFEVVSVQFNAKKISGERIRVALIDEMFQEIQNNPARLKKIIDRMGDFGKEDVEPEKMKAQLKLLESAGMKFPDDIYTKIDSIPGDINYRQMVFFAIIDSKITPEVVSKMQMKEKEMLDQGKILDVKTMREVINKDVAGYLESVSKIFDTGHRLVPNSADNCLDLAKLFF